MTIAQWFTLLVLTAIIFAVRQQRALIANSILLIVVLPIHLLYLALIVLAIVPDQITTASCQTDQVYPYMMMAADCLFAGVYVLCLVLHCCSYCVKQPKRDDFENENEFDQQLLNTRLFE
jgi:hypothetical protein